MMEHFSVVLRGVLWAVLIAWVLYAVKIGGYRVIPFVGIPLISAWMLGHERGYRKGGGGS